MARTPDRAPGPSDEEAIDFEDTAASPSIIGRVQRNGAQLLFKKDAGVPVDLAASGGGSDIKDIKVSANDTTAAFLISKLLGSQGISFSEQNDAGNETLQADLVINDLDFLLENDPPEPGTDYSLTRTSGQVTLEEWTRTGGNLLKDTTISRTSGLFSSEVVRVFDTDGSTVLAQTTLSVTRDAGGQVVTGTKTRDV